MTPYLLTHFQIEYSTDCLTVYLPAQERELDIDVVALMPLRAPGDKLVPAAPGAAPIYPELQWPANKAFASFKVDCDPSNPQFFLMMMISDEVIVSTTGRSVSGPPRAPQIRDAWRETVRDDESSNQIYVQFSHLHWESAVIAVPVR